MTKSQLITELAARCELPRKQAEQIVKLFFGRIDDALCAGERVEIRGFGSLQNRIYPGYRGLNPKTRESIDVAPKILPMFRVGKALHQRVNEENS